MFENEEKTFMELIKVIQDPIAKLHDMLRSYGMTLQKIKWDIENWREKLGAIKSEYKVWEMKIEDAKNEAQKIIETGRQNAAELEAMARQKVIEADKRLVSVKDFCEGVEKRKYKEMKEQVAA